MNLPIKVSAKQYSTFVADLTVSKEELLQYQVEFLTSIIAEHKKVFDWIERNPGCNIRNIRSEIARLNKELED